MATSLSGQIYACRKCSRRLNCDNLQGSVVIICRHCKEPNWLTSEQSRQPAFDKVNKQHQ